MPLWLSLQWTMTWDKRSLGLASFWRLPSLREYSQVWGLTEARVARMRPHAPVMHPGPMNEGVEIAADVAAGAQSVITDQVTNGVAVRMAVLYLLAGTHGTGSAGGTSPA